jgi:hypothetical protein
MAAQAVVFQDCRARGVNLERNLIQTSLGRLQRAFYVLFCVFNVPCPNPSPASECALPPGTKGGWTQSPACEGWGSPN